MAEVLPRQNPAGLETLPTGAHYPEHRRHRTRSRTSTLRAQRPIHLGAEELGRPGRLATLSPHGHSLSKTGVHLAQKGEPQ